jgi:hypothetical protein
MTKIAGSGSISQRHGSAGPDPDPDPPQNVMDPQQWMLMQFVSSNSIDTSPEKVNFFLLRAYQKIKHEASPCLGLDLYSQYCEQE